MAKSRLHKTINEKNEFLEISESQRNYQKIKKIQRRKELIKKNLILFVSVSLFLSFIYVPGLFVKEEVKLPLTSVTVSYNSEPLGIAKYLYQNYPTSDFDNDGVINRDESNKSSNGYFFDTDLDGLSDFYEIQNSTEISIPNPDIYKVDALNCLKKNGKTYGDPYKVADLVLWASDENSRIYGTVTYTLDGNYKFENFKGKISVSDGSILYKFKNGIHTKLKYDKDNDCYIVDEDCVVVKETQDLKMTCKFTVFGNKFYLSDNFLTRGISFILPSKGFISAQRMAKIDTNSGSTGDVTTINLSSFTPQKMGEARLTTNTVLITDLLKVKESLDSKNPVIVSLLNISQGEYLGIINGYTADGNLVISDYNTKQYVGVLKINETAINTLDKSGNLVNAMYFEFEGLGCSSVNGDRIYFGIEN